MSSPDQEKLGVKLHARLSLDTISAIPIKKRRFIFSRSPSPPPETNSSLTVDCGTTQNKSFSLVQTPSLEASDILTCLTASTNEGSSLESGFNNFVNGDVSENPKHQDPIEHDCNLKLESKASIAFEEENGLKDTVSDDKPAFLKGIEQHSAPVGHVDAPMEEEILDAKNFSSQTSAARLPKNTELLCKETFEKVHISESRSVRQAQLELQDPNSLQDVQDPQKKCFASGPNTDSAQSCLDRSNWDLNMTMDAWDESMNDSARNHEDEGHKRSGFVSFLGRGPQPFLMGASPTNRTPNASPPLSSEPKSLSNDHFLSLCTSPKSGGVCCNTETEACLDLHLKPALMSESYFPHQTPFCLGNADSLKETQFLILSTMPSSSSADPKYSICGAVKSEPYHECIQLEEKKTEIAGSEAFGLKPIKSEQCEIGEASKITISGVNSASDAAIKLEPVENKSQDSVAGQETRLSHISADDHNLLQSSKTPLEAVSSDTMALNTKSDSFIMQIPGEYTHLHKFELDSISQVMQNEVLSNDKIVHRTMSAGAGNSQSENGIFCEPKSLFLEPLVDKDKELISIKQASNEGSEHADSFIKSQVEGQIMNNGTSLESEACEQPHIAAESLCESFNSGTFVERVFDEKAEIDFGLSLSKTDSKTTAVVETYTNSDALKFIQAMNQPICMMEEQDDNECKTGSPNVIGEVMRAVHEKVGINDHGYEDGEVKDGAFLGANGDSNLRVETKMAEGTCPRDIADVPVAMSSSDELVKHSIIESSEMSKDLGTVECANNIDPAIATDLQESSSVTGDSNRVKTSKTTKKIPRDSTKKDKVSERKTKSDKFPTLRVASIENNANGSSGIMEKAGGRAKSSVPLSSSEAITDAYDRGPTGRIINLNSASSRNMNPIHERPLLSKVERDNSAYELFMRDKSHSRHSRDENPIEKSLKTENDKKRGLACGNHGSGSINSRVKGGSDSSRLRFRDKQRPNQFIDRNCDPNYIREQINEHNDFAYSRPISSAEISLGSGSDASASCAGRISRKVTNKLQSRPHMACRRHSPGGPDQMPVMRHPTGEVMYVSQEKMNRPVPGEMLDPLRAQFERTDRIPAHHERLSLSPMRRRGPPRLTPPMCSPRSQARSPSHWPPHDASEGFNGTPIVMQESMRSTRQHYAEEILARRRGSTYRARLPDGMMEVVSSREHDFPRPPGRDFPRKIQRLDMNDPRQVPAEYYRTPFDHGQIHELFVDGERAVGRRCNEVHVPARYRQHCFEGDDVENFSFRGEEGPPPRSYRYHPEGNQGFNEGGNSREFEGRFKNRLGNPSRRYRHIEQQQHEDGFRHQDGQGWNDSGFNNIRPKRRRY
ncbi:uncharacterized protein LOC110104021 [Dendrobium catenatum]|uniref:Uncharacterized protein n=1 Tax=Dendrobium catenatum TaxID=906689 RepID=A0A2I0WG33_9ASPA|nr:uncharacterized protein LOC110104021 [Dendrobium catenatum]XP_020688614.1 uncharacterized protein LOC110104021 [Dendrobium catenatum]XP_028552650.1 uncharacterized protein LOC110104021 [Dendrobium catenatum]PKU74634.1 hypothetical protein MA16_Dca004825 [Dendrobium catenatum]